MARVDADAAYANFCRKFAGMFEIATSSQDKVAVLDLVNAGLKELGEVVGNDDIPRSQQYNCAIIVSLMRVWPAYTSQERGALEKGLTRLNTALKLADLPPADEVVIRAIMHQFSTNDVAPLSDETAGEANGDLLLAARHLRRLAGHIPSK